MTLEDSQDTCAVLFLLSFSAESFHQTRDGCRCRSTGTWDNWITTPVIMEWLFQMGVLLTLAFFFFIIKKIAFSVEKAHLSACCTSTDTCGKVFYSGNDSYPQDWWDISSIDFHFSHNFLVSPLAFSAWNQDKLVKTAAVVFCLFRGNRTRGNTPLRIPSRIWIPQDLILIWPIPPLNQCPPPREINWSTPWLQVSCSMLRVLSFHHHWAWQKDNIHI